MTQQPKFAAFHAVWFRLVAAMCLLVCCGVTVAQTCHIHRIVGGGAARSPAMVQDAGADHEAEPCSLCESLHLAWFVEPARVLVHSQQFAGLLLPFHPDPPQRCLPFDLKSRPPPDMRRS